MPTIFPFRNLDRVYCAGPLFNAAERREMLQIAAVLRASGFEPFVPHADGMEFAELHPYFAARGHDPTEVGQWLHAAIFALDTYQVVAGCGSLLLNLNGRVPDEGAVAEATMAWMLGKPVVGYKQDARSAVAGRDNPLVVGPLGFCTIDDMQVLGESLRRKIVAAELDPTAAVACPAAVEQTVQAGERLWNALLALGSVRPLEPVADVVWELFGHDRHVTRHSRAGRA